MDKLTALERLTNFEYINKGKVKIINGFKINNVLNILNYLGVKLIKFK